MNLSHSMFRTAALVCAGAGLMFGVAATGGCKSHRESIADKGISEAKSLKTSLSNLNPQLGNTLTSLNSIFDPKVTSKQAAFNDFSKNLTETRSMARRVKEEADSMNTDASRYFTAWDKEISRAKTADARETKAATKAEQLDKYKTIQEYLSLGNTKFQSMTTNLVSIQEMLKGNLTPEGLSAARPLLDQINTAAPSLKGTIDSLIAEMGKTLPGV